MDTPKAQLEGDRMEQEVECILCEAKGTIDYPRYVDVVLCDTCYLELDSIPTIDKSNIFFVQ